jgi:hypothetical protein
MKPFTMTIVALILAIPFIFRKKKPTLQAILLRHTFSRKDEYLRYDIDDFLT